MMQGAKAPRGFGVRVTASGARAFVLNYRLEARIPLHDRPWPDWSALEAVQAARELRRSKSTAARTPSTIERLRRRPLLSPPFLTDFVARYVRTLALAQRHEYVSAFNRLVKPRIGKLGIYEVRRSHVIKMLDEIEDKNGPVMADRTLAYVRKAFNWYATRDDQFNVPVVRGMARIKPKERARTRALSDDEIRLIWPALGEAGTFGAWSGCCCLRRSAAMRLRA